MPLGSRDVLIIVRARDLASRELETVGRAFTRLGREVAASQATMTRNIENNRRELDAWKRAQQDNLQRGLAPLNEATRRNIRTINDLRQANANLKQSIVGLTADQRRQVQQEIKDNKDRINTAKQTIAAHKQSIDLLKNQHKQAIAANRKELEAWKRAQQDLVREGLAPKERAMRRNAAQMANLRTRNAELRRDMHTFSKEAQAQARQEIKDNNARISRLAALNQTHKNAAQVMQRDYNKALQDATRASKDFETQQKAALEKALLPHQRAIQTNAGLVRQLTEENKRLTASTKTLSAEGRAAAQRQIAQNNARIAALTAANQAHKDQASILRNDYNRALQDATRRSKEYERAQRDLHAAEVARVRAISDQAARLREVGHQLLSVGTVMAFVGGATVGAFAAMTNSSARFRQEAAVAVTQVDGISASIAEMEQVAINVGGRVPENLDTLQEALYDIFSSIDVRSVEEAEFMLTQFGKAAVAGASDARTAARATIAMVNAFNDGNVTSENITRALDVQFETVRKGVITYDELANSIGRAIPAANQTGQSIETLGGALAFATRQGLSAEMAATSVARAFELLGHSKVVNRLQALGVAVKGPTGEYRQFNEVMTDLAATFADMTAPERAKALEDLFQGAGNRIQARRFIIQALENIDLFNRMVAEMETSAGVMDDAYNIMFEQPLSQIQLLKNNLRILGVSIGRELLPFVNTLVKWAKNLVSWFTELDDGTKSLLVRFGFFAGLLTTLVGLATAASGAFLILRATVFQLTGQASLMAAAGKGLQAAWGFALNPVGLGIVAVSAAIGGLLWYTNRLRSEFAGSQEAASQLADSLGVTYNAIEDIAIAAGEAGDAVGQFATENAAAIRTLEEMSESGAQGFLLEIGYSLVTHGATPEEAFAAVQRLAKEANIEVPFTMEDLTDTNALVDAARSTGEEIVRAWQETGMGAGRVNELITGMAESIADALKAGDVETAILRWIEFEETITNSGESTLWVRDQLQKTARQIIELTDVQGLSLDSTHNMIDALRELSSDASTANQDFKDFAEALVVAHDEGWLTAEAVSAIAREFFYASSSANELLGVTGQFTTSTADSFKALGGALAGLDFGELADEASEFADELEDLPRWVEDLADAYNSFIDPQRAYQDALQETEDALREHFDREKDRLRDLADASDWSSQRRRDAIRQVEEAERAALENVRVSIDDYIDKLREQVREQESFATHAALVAEELGPAFAAALALNAPEMMSEFASAIHEGLDLTAQDIEYILPALMGGMNLEAAGREFVENLLGTPIDELPDELGDLAVLAGERVGDGLAEGLSSRLSEYRRQLVDYVTSTTEIINPILHALGKPNIRGGHFSYSVGSTQYGTGVSAGGVGDGPGMAYNALTESNEPIEALNPGNLAVMEATTAAGGGAYGGLPELPKPPGMSGFNTFIKDMGDGGMEWLYKYATEWIKENSAPQLGPGIGWEAMWAALQQAAAMGQIPPVALFSAYRPGAITATGNRSYHGMGRAVDITPSMAIFNWLVQNYGSMSREIIFSPAGHRQIRNGRPHWYSEPTRGDHWDHIHWAMANGGIVNSPVSAFLGEAGPEAVMPLDTFGQAVSVLQQIAHELKKQREDEAKKDQPGTAPWDAMFEGVEKIMNLIDATMALEDAFKNVADAQKNLAQAHKNYEDLLKEEQTLREELNKQIEISKQVTAQEELDIIRAEKAVEEARKALEEAKAGPTLEERIAIRQQEQLIIDLRKQVKEQIEFDEKGRPRPKTVIDEAAVASAQQRVEDAQQSINEAKADIEQAQAALATAKAAHQEAMAMVAQAEADLALANFEVARVRQVAEIVEPHDEVAALLMEYKALKERADAEKALADAQLEAAEREEEVANAQKALVDAQGALKDATRELADANKELQEAQKGTKISWTEMHILLLQLEKAEKDHAQMQEDMLNNARDIREAELELMIAEENLNKVREDSVALNEEAIDIMERLEEIEAEKPEALQAIEDAEHDLTMAQLELVGAQIDYITALEATIGLSDDVGTFFEQLMSGAGAATSELVKLINAINTATGLSINPPTPPPPTHKPITRPTEPDPKAAPLPSATRPRMHDGGVVGWSTAGRRELLRWLEQGEVVLSNRTADRLERQLVRPPVVDSSVRSSITVESGAVQVRIEGNANRDEVERVVNAAFRELLDELESR